jgi:hypothetical protein
MEKTNIKTLEVTRHIRDEHYEQLKDKTREERMTFYREKARMLNAKAQATLQEHEDEEQST